METNVYDTIRLPHILSMSVYSEAYRLLRDVTDILTASSLKPRTYFLRTDREGE